MSIEVQDESTLTPDEQILKEARRRFIDVQEAEREIRQEAEMDLRFLSGEQWDPVVQHERKLANRPCLTFNRLPTYVQQVSNQARQNKPSVKVHPVDSAADVDTAKVNQGIIRHIEYDSNADTAYDTALQYAASCGVGYFRFTTEYCDEDSFDLTIKCVRVEDPMSVYMDPYAKEPDGSDAMYGFVVDKMSCDEFEERWGKEDDEHGGDFWGELAEEGWLGDDGVRVAEYWRVEVTKRKLRMVKGPDGIPQKVYTDDEGYDENANFVLDAKGKPREREVEVRKVCQYLINGARILEKNEWVGKWIPIVRVLGQELYVAGKRKLFSLVRFVREPQQLLNYYKTVEAETISLMPRPKWVGYLGQFKTKSKDWQRANVSNAAYLEVDPISVNGTPAPLPKWERFDAPIQEFSIASAQCVDDIKAGTGIFDASIGQQARETSGIAIQKRKQQSDISNFHFIDNLSRAQRFGGRIMLDLIPKIYDTARQVRIVGDDEKQRVIKVNTPFTDEDGKQQHYQLDSGKYDVTVSTGASYQTQRQEAFDLLTQMAAGDPQIMAIGGDIIFANSDIPGGDQLAERWKRNIALTMPGVIKDEDSKDVPVGVQMQLAQGQQVMQAMQGEIQKLTDVINQKQVESASRERIAELQAAAQIDVAQIKAGFDAATKQLIEDMKAAADGIRMAHEAAMASGDRAHQADQAAGDRAHEAVMKQSDQYHQAGMQAQDQEHQAGMQGEQLQAQAEQAKQTPPAE